MRTRRAHLAVSLAGACILLGAAVPAGAQTFTRTVTVTPPRLFSLRGQQVPLVLDAGPFPHSGHPNAIAYVPRGFTGVGPVQLVVFVHGWRGCAQVIIDDTEAPCERGGEITHAYHLADAMEATGKDAILLVLQGPYDARSNDDGTLADQGGFRAIVTEALAKLALAAGEPPDAPPLPLGGIQVVAHSGAVQAVADILDRGGLDDHLVEVDLLDVLYTRADSYARWLDREAVAAARDPSHRRFVVVYTCCAGTAEESRELATRPLPAAAAAASRPVRVVAHTTGPLTADELAAPILFVQTDVDHDPLPLVYFPLLVSTSALRNAPAAVQHGVSGGSRR